MHLSLALLLFSGSPSQGPRAAGPVVDPAARVDPVVVDLAGLGPASGPHARAEITRLVRARVSALLRRHRVPTLGVTITIAWQDAALVDYAVSIDLHAQGDRAARRERRATGHDTDTIALADVVASTLDRLLVERARERPVSTPPPAVVTPTPVVPPRIEPVATPVRAIGPMGGIGIGTAIFGVCSVGFGIGVLAMPPSSDPHDTTKLRTWQPAGIVLTTVGGAAIVTGVTLAAVDGRRRALTRRMSVAPWGRRRAAGVQLAIRF